MLDNQTNGGPLLEEIQKLASKKYKEEELKPRIYYTGNIVIDMPRKKGQYHGSSYTIQPAHCYNIEGDSVASTEIRDIIVRNLKENDCEITDIHEYPGGGILPISKDVLESHSHIHFKCKHKSDTNIVKILQQLPELR